MNMDRAICLDEEMNVSAKYMFRKQRLDAIKKNDNKAFKECVKKIGTAWGTIRRSKVAVRDSFIDTLWDNTEAMQSGSYEWNKSNYSAYSYESKICFLINPLHYKIIYDSKNAAVLAKRYNWSINQAQWQARVEQYYSEIVHFSPKDEADIDRIFREDFYLWASDKAKMWLFSENGKTSYKQGHTEEEAKNNESLSV